MSLFKTLTRILAIVGKELVSIVRRPGALISLVLGPFLIMALFGVGYSGFRRPLDTIVVLPAESGLPTDVKTYQDVAGEGLRIDSVTSDEASAMDRLRGQLVDVVVVAPADVQANFKAGKRSEIDVRVNVTDPVQGTYAIFLARGLEAAVNRQIIAQAVSESEGYAVSQGAGEAVKIPPDLIAAPTEAKVQNVAQSTPTVVQYFAPAVLALILQHLAVTLIALSVVREKNSGLFELFRIS
ncbi:MAG: ABC transporter permease, partial [Candidatus Limnocylindrales bacterium]